MINIVQGANKDIVVRVTDGDTKDPFDFTGVSLIRACFTKKDFTSLYVFYLAMSGVTANLSATISGIADTSNIAEGMPISGAGIPVNATVLKTPQSLTSPTAANTILISAAATASATVTLTIGTIQILSAIIGKIMIPLQAVDTDSLEANASAGFEVLIIKNDFSSYIQFPGSLNIVERLC